MLKGDDLQSSFIVDLQRAHLGHEFIQQHLLGLFEPRPFDTLLSIQRLDDVTLHICEAPANVPNTSRARLSAHIIPIGFLLYLRAPGIRVRETENAFTPKCALHELQCGCSVFRVGRLALALWKEKTILLQQLGEHVRIHTSCSEEADRCARST